MLDDHWIGSCRLRRVPSVLRCIDGRQRLGFVDERLSLSVAGLGGEQGQRDWANVGLQRFPGLSAYSAWKISCTIEFDFSGESPISSDAAASTIQKAGWERNSTVISVGVTLV